MFPYAFSDTTVTVNIGALEKLTKRLESRG